LSEYEDGEIPEENDEIEKDDQQEIGKDSSIDDVQDEFEPTFNNDDEHDLEDFEPTLEIEQPEIYKNFEPTNESVLDQQFNDFKPALNENHSFEIISIGHKPDLVGSKIDSIINDPILTNTEKIKALENLKDKIWDNPDISLNDKQDSSRAIDSAKDKLTRPSFDNSNISNEIIKPNAQKNEELPESTLDHKNLLNEKVQTTFKNYFQETGKYPNFGRNLKKEFIDWGRKTEKNQEILDKIQDIQNNHEISNFLSDKIRNSNLSQTAIADKLKKIGLSVDRKTVGNYALNETFNGNKVEYNKRFDKSLKPEIRDRIINRLNEEVEKFALGDRHSSLYKIAKDFPEVHKTTIDKIAKNEISQAVYKKMWPSTKGTVDPGTKQNIKNVIEREVQEGNLRSLRNISKDFTDVSTATIKDLAKEMYPEKYNEFWPAIEKIPEDMKVEIITTIKKEAQKENPRTLRDIHGDFPEVGADSIKRIAKEVIPKDVHDRIWPPLTTKIPKELALQITKTLKDEIHKPKPRPLNEISRFFGVSSEYVRKLAKKTISKQVYEDIWKGHEPITDTVKNDIIKDIVNTKLNISEIAEKNRVSPPSVSNISQREVFQDNIDAHRERFPIDKNLEIGTFTHLNINSLLTRAIANISKQKYYAEPNLYFGNRRPDGLILEDNNFIHQRLTNPQTGEYLRDKLDLEPKNLDYIKNTQFDFTNDVNDENLIDKIEKYQSEDSLLVIVGTRWFQYDDIKPLPIDDRIKYPENVRVVSHNLGATLIGLEGENKGLYDKIIDFNNDHDLDALKALYNYDLSSINTHNTEELKQDLIQKGLIKEDFSEYFNFEVLNKKDDKEKQLDLDHFLNG